ncbi:MAG: DUF1801 domain-containing protein [Bacteroidales bacterium]|nr:DUF1801 domain-containing protein [Bacteroidales bacterium]
MKPDPKVIEYIEQYPPEFQAILFRLRELIYLVVPDAAEAIKWSAATFSYQKKSVCYLAGFTNHVTFAFHNGTMLNDPDGILLGTGKFMRYMKFRSPKDIDEEQMKIWILEGFYT